MNNARLVYIISFLWGIILIQAISVPFFASRDLSSTDIILLQSVFSFLLVFLDIPTGWITDKIGAHRAIQLASLLRGIGATIFVFAYGFWAMLAGYLFIAAANALLSGADLAALYEAQSEDSAHHKLKKLHSYAYLAGAIATLAGAMIGAIFSLEIAIVLNMILAWLPLPLSLLLTSSRMIANRETGESVGFFRLAEGSNRPFLICATIIVLYQFVYFIAFYSLPIGWQEQHLAIGYFGVLFFLSYMLNALFSSISTKSYFPKFFYGAPFLLLSFVFADNLIVSMFAFVVAIPFLNVYSQVVLRKRVNDFIEDRYRATANSIISFGGRGLFFGFAALAGLVSMNVQHMMVAAAIISIPPFVMMLVYRSLLSFEEVHQ